MQKIGAHVSAAGGAQNAPLNAKLEKCETFQFFVSSPRTFQFKQPTTEQIAEFKANCEAGGFTDTYVHASYLINLASTNNKTRHGSISLLRKGLDACALLGVTGMMFHTGSAKDYENKADGIKQAAASINKVLDGYKGKTKLLIENAAGAGSTIGMNFTEVGELMKLVDKKYTKHLGVCLDTQHSFASGYDWRTKAGTDAAVKEFDKKIGLDNLVVIQYNDSKTECGSNKDRHEHIADGNMGLQAAKNILGHPKLKNYSFCLETEPEGRAKDIKTLKTIRQK
ncbi:MAG: hypothetical protein COW24_04930 [Candidatus Kerfeldbacteria bacterium CG15_BIG_FIL_POST_REV_8_21_14_020_45_12]|uniref:Probable endonuclease 4 n=1 Tax=Candidatus Kerfeldbacteria bacterium CG15_BIG_FIL_POST_REV_8_21_14_020_45_12 TaxID=2014247 RepID=A0A2M7H2Q4_9BACT|nr:MAG: hypothetical protein COW24_04930 [Candidatus Kerfeldbacteria bacterium CG15_BIG_FIL_POST_REV_8_21_14_020_45_12]PJA93239.1 MAG: hypothetical protein CO132_03985 [Candidatus Kerfeldbacteria bacterium CG_4_9_14_3_um_filter_45_8]